MDRFAVRRKLLRGSLSAPLVLTVTAAGAQVRTTFGACLERTANETPPLERLAPITANGDTWYRVLADVVTVVDNGTTTYYLKQFGGSLYFKLDATNPYTTVPSGPVALPTGGTQTTQQVAALAFFNQHGTVTGYAWDNSGAFTTKSCYASVF